MQDIALSGVIGALSYALDITEGQPAGHAVRSCMIGMRIAEELQLPARTRSDLYEALTADRPYRGPLPEEKALDIVSWEVPGRLDRSAFGALEIHLGRGTDPPAPGVLTVAEPPTPGLSAAPPRSHTRPFAP